MRRSSQAANFSVGFVLFVATILVIVTLFWVGSGKGFFSSRVEYTALIPSTSGLAEGSKVYLSGIPVGTVTGIEFADDLEINSVRVTLSIREEVAPRIREDSFVWLQTRGLLGDNEVHIAMGTLGAAPLEEDSAVPFKGRTILDEVVGAEITDTTSRLLMGMMRTLEEIQKGEGTLGQLLKNPELYDNLTRFVASLDTLGGELEFMSREVREMMSDVKARRGLLGKVLFSDEYEERISRTLEQSTELIARLNRMAGKLEGGEGSVGRLLADTDFHDKARDALGSLSTAADSLVGVIDSARKERSVLGRILTDPELGEDAARLVERLERSVSSLGSVLALLERGEGSLGMILHDPSIAASMRNIFLGVQEKGYVRSMIRNAELAGQEVALREARMVRRALDETSRVEAAVSRGTVRTDTLQAKPAAARDEEDLR